MTYEDVYGHDDDQSSYEADLDRLAAMPREDVLRGLSLLVEGLRVGREVFETAGLDPETIPMEEVMRAGNAELMNRVCVAGEQAGEGDPTTALETLGGLGIAEKILPSDVVGEVVVEAFNQQMIEEW